MTATRSMRRRRKCMSTAMLFSTCLCMLLRTSHALRGATVQRPPRSAPRMLMMETPVPTSSPTERPPPSPSPSALVQPIFLQLPTATPSQEPTTNDTPEPTKAPQTDPPTSSPTTVPPSTSPQTSVTMADFSIQYTSSSLETPENEAYGMQAVTQEYLFQRMKRDYNTLQRIELIVNAQRNLQTTSLASQKYSGSAYFDSLQPVPSIRQVQYSQTVALNDTESLQRSYEMAGLTTQVQQVEVAPLPEEPTNDTAVTNAGLIAGVSIGAVILVGLLMFAGYKWYSSRECNCLNVIDLDKDTNQDDYVKYTPDDFEPVETSQDDMEDDSVDPEMDVSSVDMDEFSLSAASADSSVKRDPEERRQSLLQKLALYQKTEKKAPAENNGTVPMPAALFVPQVVGDVNDEDSAASSSIFSSSMTPDSPRVDVMDSPGRVTEQSRAVSLLDQSGMTNDESTDEEYDEEDLLPPPPVPVSTSRSTEWALEESSGQELVLSDHGMQSQWSLSPMQQVGEENVETQIVPVTHDFPSTTWAHSMALVTTRSYSDGPSDEMNAVLEQDLANFDQLAIVSPATDATPVRRGRSMAPPSPERPPPPPTGPPPRQSRARSTERRPSGKPPRVYEQQNATAVTPPRRQRASSSRSRRGLELKEVEPPANARRRPRSSSSRRRTSEDERSYDDASYDGSFASNGSEVLEDLNTLSDFLRERRDAKRAQRRERAQERSSSSQRR